MTEITDDSRIQSLKEREQQYSQQLGTEGDPLKRLSTMYEGLPDPFEYFLDKRIRESDLKPDTISGYERDIGQWKQFMSRFDRHPACPSENHVAGFIRWQRNQRGNSYATIYNKIINLNAAYRFWQANSYQRHPQEYNPITNIIDEVELKKKANEEPKEFPWIELDEIRTIVAKVKNIKVRSIIGIGFKMGLRASETCNIKLEDIAITHEDLNQAYPELGTAEAIGDKTNVLYIPSDRDGNKSKCGRMIPIDDELRLALIRYLLIRPSVDEPWVFLSDRFTKMPKRGVIRFWKELFQPQYAETEKHRGITSHYGRHWFTTFWSSEQDMNREHLKYLRGDVIFDDDEQDGREAIDGYIHTQYSHIEQQYRDNIFQLFTI